MRGRSRVRSSHVDRSRYIGFKNLSGRPDAAWLSSALAEMFTSELAAGEQLRTIPGENVAQMKVNLALTDAESFGRETLARIRTNLGTDLVVLGSYVALSASGNGQIRLDLRLQDAALGETVASVTDTGREEDLLDLVSRAGARLRDRLGVGEVPADAKAGVRAALPSNSDAARAYAEGLARLRQFDVLAARDLLAKAVATDPTHALAYSALGEAWHTLGYDQKAKAAAERAFALSTSLSREERLLVEARLRAITPQWDRAVEIYRTLWGFFPDNIDYGLALATAQTSAGKGRDALATIAALRQLPSPAAADPRIDLQEASAATSVSDFARAQTAAAGAATKAGAHGARLLVARARLAEGAVRYRLGDFDQARIADQEAQRLFAEADDRFGVASALTSLSIVAGRQGDLELARKTGEEALAMARDIGNEGSAATGLVNIGFILNKQGDTVGARKKFEEALTAYRNTESKSGVATISNNLGAILHIQGRLTDAEAKYQEALALQREIGNKSAVSLVLNNIGEVREAQGRLAEARSMYEDSLAIAREIGSKQRMGYTMTRLGGILRLTGERTAARTTLVEALAIRTAMGAKGDAAETQLALAALSLEDGRPGDAETTARKAAEEFQREKMIDGEAGAYDWIARSLLVLGKTADARAAIERASSLAAESEDRRVRLSIGLTRARTRATTGATAEAIKSLESTLADAKKAGFLDLEFEVRLALGDIETRSSKPAAGLARLAALEKDAAALGFGPIAKKAADANQPSAKR